MMNLELYSKASLHNKKDSLSNDVYNEILLRLMDNRLVPGTMLNRRDVAKELGVSVAPVLEAMLRLELEGFLESVPRKGSLIKPVKREDLFGQLMVREALECQASRLYCGKPVRDNKKALLEEAEALDSRKDLFSPKGWDMEICFHLSLIDLAQCPALSKSFIKTMQLGLFHQLNRIIGERQFLEDKHVGLIENLSVSSPNAAEQLIRRHIRKGKDRFFDAEQKRKSQTQVFRVDI